MARGQASQCHAILGPGSRVNMRFHRRYSQNCGFDAGPQARNPRAKPTRPGASAESATRETKMQGQERERGREQRCSGSRFANVKEGRSERAQPADFFADVGRFIEAGRDLQPVMGLCGQLPEHADMIKLAFRKRRRLRQLKQAIRLMAPRDRAIFLGHFVDDATFFELARLHGISAVEVEAALCRGLEILADVLEPEPWRWWRFWRR